MNFTCFVREPVLELVDHIYLRFNTHIRSCSYLRLQSLGLKDFKFKNKVTEREREREKYWRFEASVCLPVRWLLRWNVRSNSLHAYSLQIYTYITRIAYIQTYLYMYIIYAYIYMHIYMGLPT